MKSKNIFIVLFFIVCALPLRLDAIWVNDNLNAFKVMQNIQYNINCNPSLALFCNILLARYCGLETLIHTLMMFLERLTIYP